MITKNRKKSCSCLVKSIAAVFSVIVVFVALYNLFGPIPGSINHGKSLATMTNARIIAFSLHQYAVDHSGQYPTGKSSTDIFQKLIDGGYVNDPAVFRGGAPLKGTGELAPGSLKPKNVGFDVTVPVDASSPDNLPVVFLTGYKVLYSPGANALPLSSVVKNRIPCMAAAYKNLTATYFERNNFLRNYFTRGYSPQLSGEDVLGPGALSDGTIPHFMPADFDAKGRVYHQLTPDGERSP